MGLVYEPASDGPIRQAELLTSVSEFQAIPDKEGNANEVATRRIEHPLAIVLSQDCDLEQDFNVRHPAEQPAPDREAAEASPAALTHILLCDAHEESELKKRLPDGLGSKDFRRIAGNQNERYHRIDGADVGDTGVSIEPLFLDFRRHFSIPCPAIYEQFASGLSGRTARLPAYYLHDLNHRFYSYLARVAIP
jgi:hypothetical protein